MGIQCRWQNIYFIKLKHKVVRHIRQTNGKVIDVSCCARINIL